MTPAEQQAVMEAFLAQESQGMWPTLPSIDEDWRDLQGDFFTTAKQGATLAADPSFLLTNNLLAPGATDPLTSFEPVEMPGASLIAKWRQGNPYQKWAAAMFDADQPVSTMISHLSRMVAQPEDAQQEEIVSYLPPGFFYDEVTGESKQTGPDLRAIGDELRNIEQMKFSDPQNTVIDPSTGLPSTVTTEEHPLAIKARSLGYVSTPGQPYSPYDFAPEGVTPESDAALKQAMMASAIQSGMSEGVVDSARRKAAEAQQRWLMTPNAGGYGPLTPAPARTAAAAAANPAGVSAPVRMEGGALGGIAPGLPGGRDMRPEANQVGRQMVVNPSTGSITYTNAPAPQPTTSGGVRATLDGGGDLTTNRPFLPASDLTVNPSTGGRTGTPRQAPGPRAPGDPLSGPVEWTDQYGGRGPLPDLGFGFGQSAGPPGARSGEGGYIDPRSQVGDLMNNEGRGWSLGKGSPPPEPGPSRGWSLGKGSGPNGLNPPVGQQQQGSNVTDTIFDWGRAVELNARKAQAQALREALYGQQVKATRNKRNYIQAAIANDKARRADLDRQAMVQQLTAQGRTKFGDEVQRRMAAIYGMGM